MLAMAQAFASFGACTKLLPVWLWAARGDISRCSARKGSPSHNMSTS